MAKTTRQTSQERVKRESKAQHERAPMLAVRVPRSLYRALKAAAKDDKRTLADWLRLNLPRLISVTGIYIGDDFEMRTAIVYPDFAVRVQSDLSDVKGAKP